MVREGYAPYVPLLAELKGHFWDTLNFRTADPQSPHRELSDIWLRYNALANFDGNLARFNAPHAPEWYPVARELPSAQALCERIAQEFDSDLGGVLMTKIPAGKQCYPHIDRGWHAQFYEKYAFQVKGHHCQTFHVENEVLHTRSGDLFWFDNAHTHWVLNPSAEDRITMIVCLRRH